jgi:hypothetical protein
LFAFVVSSDDDDFVTGLHMGVNFHGPLKNGG